MKDKYDRKRLLQLAIGLRDELESGFEIVGAEFLTTQKEAIESISHLSETMKVIGKIEIKYKINPHLEKYSFDLSKDEMICLKKIRRHCSDNIIDARPFVIDLSLAEKILYLILSKDARDHIPGDLEEELNTIILPKFGVRYARMWYWKQVVSSIFPILWGRILKLFAIGWLTKAVNWLWSRVGS